MARTPASGVREAFVGTGTREQTRCSRKPLIPTSVRSQRSKRLSLCVSPNRLFDCVTGSVDLVQMCVCVNVWNAAEGNDLMLVCARYINTCCGLFPAVKNVVGVIARYMTALQEFRRSVSMKVAFDRVGVDRNTISRTAAIAELSLAAPEVFHALPPWDEKEETLAHYAVRCRQAMDENIKAKIKAMKAKGELLPIVSK